MFDLIVGEIADVMGNFQLCGKFSQRTFGDVKKSDRIFVGFSLVALGDVAWNTDCTPPHLVNQRKVMFDCLRLGQTINIRRQCFGSSPNNQTSIAVFSHKIYFCFFSPRAWKLAPHASTSVQVIKSPSAGLPSCRHSSGGFCIRPSGQTRVAPQRASCVAIS